MHSAGLLLENLINQVNFFIATKLYPESSGIWPDVREVGRINLAELPRSAATLG
jgi:hypothetical protein